jgi:SET domain-containing protein
MFNQHLQLMNKSSLTNSDGPIATFADENVNETVRL